MGTLPVDVGGRIRRITRRDIRKRDGTDAGLHSLRSGITKIRLIMILPRSQIDQGSRVRDRLCVSVSNERGLFVLVEGTRVMISHRVRTRQTIPDKTTEYIVGMQSLTAKGWRWGCSIRQADEKGDMEGVRRAHDNGWKGYYAAYPALHAVRYNTLENLRYAYDNGCPWELRTCAILFDYCEVVNCRSCAPMKKVRSELYPILYDNTTLPSDIIGLICDFACEIRDYELEVREERKKRMKGCYREIKGSPFPPLPPIWINPNPKLWCMCGCRFMKSSTWTHERTERHKLWLSRARQRR